VIRLLKRSVLAAGLVGALVAVGCSGPGVTIATIQSADLQDIAADNVSAVLLARSWINVLYDQDIKGGPCQRDSDWEVLSDGSAHTWGTNSDCSTYDYVDTIVNGGHGTILYPDGTSSHITWSLPRRDGPHVAQDIFNELSDGTQLDFTYGTERDSDISQRVGSAILTDGRKMDFVLTHDRAGLDVLALDLPDGSAMQLRTPFTGRGRDPLLPDFGTGATGTFTPPAGQPLDFAIDGTADRGEIWNVSAPDGTEGRFTLGDDFTGSGQITRDGQLQGALRWQASGDGTLDLLAAGSAEVTPSAAARDFQVDRWINTVAAMGPMPRY